MIETLKDYPNGGKIDVYTLVDKTASDYEKVLACCEYFAKQGAKTVIYPRFVDTIGNLAYENIFASLKGTQYWGKNIFFNFFFRANAFCPLHPFFM